MAIPFEESVPSLPYDFEPFSFLNDPLDLNGPPTTENPSSIVSPNTENSDLNDPPTTAFPHSNAHLNTERTHSSAPLNTEIPHSKFPSNTENPPSNASDSSDSDSNSTDSSSSNCPSWMLEDLEERQRRQDERNLRDEGWGSDAAHEDELISLTGSDDEEPGYEKWNDRMNMENVEFSVGFKFPTREKYREANYKYLGKKIESIIRDNPNEGLISLKGKIMRDVQVECNMHKVYTAKRYALERIKGNIKQQYERLYDYSAIVEKHNPSSPLVLKVDRSLSPPLLQRMYYCLSGLRAGFLDGCRPIIGLDGCFLKGMYKGQLLAAVGRDESFNSYILDAREQPIIDIFETIRRKLMTRIQVKREGIEKYDGVVSTLGTVDPPHEATKVGRPKKTPVDGPSETMNEALHIETENEPHPTEARNERHPTEARNGPHPTETDEISQFSEDIAYETWFSQPVHYEKLRRPPTSAQTHVTSQFRSPFQVQTHAISQFRSPFQVLPPQRPPVDQVPKDIVSISAPVQTERKRK
ncbi:UNVERIFIED_CONTAM: hypothetical protein Slati_3492200 [Sesamum latifolium]|uniref:Uncharacterized protein n=1 Tax=Sesamum latifolium TaxID=2727402 RepID=A0AAW2UIK0_9LAMI